MALQLQRLLVIGLILTSAAVAVSAEEDAADDVDRTDFSDPALSADPVAEGPHSAIETAWILPEVTDGKVPVGVTTDLLVALSNSGNKIFNISRIEAKIVGSDGKVVVKLAPYEYGQPLHPGEQRSFRFPMPIDREVALGEYTLVAACYYNTREKEPFVSEVTNDTISLVPEPPNKEQQMLMLQMGVGGAGVLVLLFAFVRGLGSGAKADKPAKAKKAASAGAAKQPNDEWLAGTLAGSESRSPKKKKKA